LLNTAEMPTADFVQYRDASLRIDERVAAIRNVVGDDNVSTLDANRIAARLLGDTIFANVLLLGAAWQRGIVPVSLDAMMRAIELNGVAVEKNKQAFSWGRTAAVDPDRVRQLIDGSDDGGDSLDALIERHGEFLVDYQDQALADRYFKLVNRVREAGDEDLTRSVARNYFKLLSYKDEYEVARLHTQTGFLEKIREDYGPDAKIRFHLSPPLLSFRTDARGRPYKKEFGGWMIPVFRLLARMRKLRGTWLDPFARTADRRLERELIVEFEALIEKLLPTLTEDSAASAHELVATFDEVRGYGPVKEEAAIEARAKIASHAIMQG
jgi:indolepyruvate ferredoxin oxidoreductase